MITWPEISVHLHRQPIDFRKAINGLMTLVESEFGLSPFAPALYVFGNRQRDKIKILYWDNNGFCLWYKRLEADKFQWPRHSEQEIIQLNPEQFSWLLRGLDIRKLTPHSPKTYTCIG